MQHGQAKSKLLGNLFIIVAWLALGALPVQAGTPTPKTTVTLIVTNAQGTVVATMTPQGKVTYTAAYRPYGKQTQGTPKPGPGYTGHVNDPATGLVYMQQRYYDPTTGRFISPDPVTPTPGNLFNFGRYTYANDNPIVNIDPDGRQSFPGDHPLRQALRTADAVKRLGEPTVLKIRSKTTINGLKKYGPYAAVVVGAYTGVDETAGLGTLLRAGARVLARKVIKPGASEQAVGTGEKTDSIGTVFVDSKGNAIPTPRGGAITGSPDGKYIQVRDADGNLTGARIDGPHKSATHPDPRAQRPHAHVPDVKNPDGTPWLPINY
ncbi:MAG TPA: RHS repeat-associated core domain-containing protein [Rhodanobacteraceae bacterium]